jgi:hypothetical protein
MAGPNINQIGAYVAVKQGNAPLANGAGTRNGAAIDRSTVGWAKSCVLSAHAGAATGTPTSFTYDVKLQDSADGSTGWADYTQPSGASSAITQQTAAGLTEKDIDLTGAKQYVRVVEVVAFVGGTSPTLPAGEQVVFGGGDSLPL